MRSGLVLLLVGLALQPAAAGELTVVSVQPAARSLRAPINTEIRVRFDRPLRRDSIEAGLDFWAFGRWSGTATGTVTFEDQDQVLRLQPNRPFAAGENVMVILSHDIEAMDGSRLRDAGYSFQFWTRTRPALMDFAPIGTLSTRMNPDEGTRPYGGVASDLDGDGFMDLAIVNEDSSDLRVFLNRADGTGRVRDFLRPSSPLGGRSSPSEPTDFNRDGFVDLCTANFGSDSVSVLLGRGDGTFQPTQEIPVGDNPHGIAVLDMDGDGDIDIATANTESDDVTILLNDGMGVFSDVRTFSGVGLGPWPLAAGDMNNDGILDLVIGARKSDQIFVFAGQGDGTFVQDSVRPTGSGRIWMVVLGDVNGDGNEDVSAALHAEALGSIMLGDGQGNLAAGTFYQVAFSPIATDLGDLDGDGDLDWLTSSAGEGRWFLFRNKGDGTFEFVEQFLAQAAASCSLMVDLDNDQDLDLALIDEIDDLLELQQNSGRQDVVPSAEAIPVNTTTPGDQAQPAVCGSPSGFVVAWTSGPSLQGQRYTESGAALGAEFTLSTGSAKQRPALACNPAGGFFASWASEGDGDGLGIFGRRFDATGQAQGPELQVSSFTTGHQDYPALARDDQGNFLALWESLGQDGQGPGVFAQRYASSGQPQGGEFQVNTQTALGQGEPTAAFHPDGGFVVVWQSRQAEGWRLRGQRYAATGAPQGTEFPLLEAATGDQTFPTVASSDESGFLVLWTATDQRSAVAGRRFDWNAVPKGEAFLVSASTLDNRQAPSISAGPDGFLAVWQAVPDQPEPGAALLGQSYDTSGLPLGGVFPTQDLSAATTAAVAAGGTGFLAVWQDPDADGAGIFAQHFGRTPTPLNNPVPLETGAPLLLAIAWLGRKRYQATSQRRAARSGASDGSGLP